MSQSEHFQGTGPNRNRENPLAGADERAQELGYELEPERVDVPTSFDEIGIPRQRNVVTPRLTYADPPPPPTLSEQLDQQVATANALADERARAATAADERLAQAERARIDRPTEPLTLSELEATERGAHVAALDSKAAAKSRDNVVARVAQIKKSPEFAELQRLTDRQSDGAIMKSVQPLEASARDLGESLGKLVVSVLTTMSDLRSARGEAERMAARLGFSNFRPGRLDQAYAITRIGRAFAAGWQAASKLPVSAIARWTGQ